MRAIHSVNIILPHSKTLIILGEKYLLWSFSLCNLLQNPATSSLLGQNIHFSSLPTETLKLYSSLSVTDKVSGSYKTTDKIIISYNYSLSFQRLSKGTTGEFFEHWNEHSYIVEGGEFLTG